MFRFRMSLSHLFPFGNWCLAPDEGGSASGEGEGEGGGESGDLFAGEGEGEGEGNGQEQLSKIMEMLADCGIKLPEDTTPEDLLDNLETALIAYKHAKEHHGIENPGGGGEGGGEGGGGAVEEPMGTQMSLEFEALKSRLARAEGVAAGERLKAIGARIKGMVEKGMVSKATANAWWKELNTKQLSLVAGDDRNVSKILDQMEILEKEHPNRLQTVVSKGKEEVPPPWVDFSQNADGKPADEPNTPEKARKVLDEVYGPKK